MQKFSSAHQVCINWLNHSKNRIIVKEYDLK